MHTYNLSTQEAETGSLQVQSQLFGTIILWLKNQEQNKKVFKKEHDQLRRILEKCGQNRGITLEINTEM